MKTTLRIIAILLGIPLALALLATVALLGFLQLSDPNDFKPRIEQLAASHNMRLRLNGPLDWQLYPSLRLRLKDAEFATKLPSAQVNATLGSADLEMALGPLLSGQLHIKGVDIRDSRILLRQLGRTLTEQATTPTPPAPPSPIPEIQIARITAQNVALELHQPTDSPNTAPQQAQIDKLEIEHLALDGRPFPLHLHAHYATDQHRLNLQTRAQVRLDPAQQDYGLQTQIWRLQLAADRQQLATEASFTLTANVPENIWTLNLDSLQAQGITARTQATGTLTPPSAAGKLNAKGSTELLRQLIGWPQGTLALDLNYRLDTQSATLTTIDLDLSGGTAPIKAQGNATYFWHNQQPHQLALNIDQIHLADFLPKPTDDPAATADQTTATDNPLSPLKTAPNLNAQIAIGKLTAAGQPLTDLTLNIATVAATAQLELTQAQLGSGTVRGHLHATPTAVTDIAFSAQNIELAELFKDESGAPSVTGQASLDFRGQWQPLTTGSPAAGVQGEGQFTASETQLPMNLEQAICQAAERFGASAALTADWPASTRLRDFATDYQVQNGLLHLHEIATGFGNLAVRGGGQLQLDNLEFDARLELRLQGDRTSAHGCSINRRLRDTPLPLRCRGKLNAGTAPSCALDSSVVGGLLQGQIKDAIQQKIGQRIERLLGSETDEQESDTENDTKKEADPVRDLLENLFK
ncbi:MAG: AsmA family protein [Cellvibrionales bacterium]|nr:AsmA family protein [Cellvibrionales bacterium]